MLKGIKIEMPELAQRGSSDASAGGRVWHTCHIYVAASRSQLALGISAAGGTRNALRLRR